MTETSSIKALLQQAATALPDSDTARLDAEVLLMHVLQKNRAWLFANPEAAPSPTQRARYRALLERRRAGEPVAYLTGTREFWSLELQVTPDVLIPRPETELLVHIALDHLRECPSPRVIDLGTGSGAIALAVASERPDARVIATDRSLEALQVARKNAANLGCENVRFVEADWFGGIPGPFDAVLSNPPYVASDDPHLERGDVRFEPEGALSPGPDALISVRQICLQAPSRMAPGALLALEHGQHQGDACRVLLSKQGFQGIQTHADLAGIERVSLGLSQGLSPE